MAEAKKVVISGYYGFGNLGDEAILGVLLEELRSLADLGVEPVVLSAAPRETSRLYGVRAVDCRNVRTIRRELRAADAFLSGGGGLLQDETSRRSALYYLALIAYAYRHCPVYLVGQGLGPLRSRPVLLLARRLLPRVAFALVRDEPSARLLRYWGLPEEHLACGSDLTLLLAPKIKQWQKEYAQPGNPYVLVALRGDLSQDFQEGLAHQLSYAQKELGLRPVFFAFYPSEDREGMEALAKRLTPRPPVLQAEGASLREVCCTFAGARAVVGMRLHALIFALLVGVPFLAVGGPTKLETFVRQVERAGGPLLPCATEAQLASFEVELGTELERFGREAEAYRRRLEDVRDALYAKTRAAMDAFLQRLRADLGGEGESSRIESKARSDAKARSSSRTG